MRLPDLTSGHLIRRYQRFLAEVGLDNGEQVTAHCPNTGSMLGLKDPDNRVWLSPATTPGRKLAWTWELVEPAPDILVGIHTGRANYLVREAIGAGLLPELDGYLDLRTEARLGNHSRMDFQLFYKEQSAWLEVKSVTAAVQDGTGFFPDAVSARALKHLEALTDRARSGDRAVVVFCVQREDVHQVQPAERIDPAFATALRLAAREGVELYALGATVSTHAITLKRRLPVVL